MNYIVFFVLCTFLPNTLATLTCYSPLALPIDASNPSPSDYLLLGRLASFGDFTKTVFGSSANLSSQIAALSQVLDVNAYVYLPITGTFGGPAGLGLEGLIEYAWIFNPYKNQLWVAPITDSYQVCIDHTLPNQLLVAIIGDFHFSPTLANPFATGTVLVEQFNYTLFFNGSSTKIASLRIDVVRQSAVRTAEAHQSIFDVCLLINQTCTGPNQVYSTIWDCIDFMSTIPTFQCEDALFQGDSFACRYLHHFLAVFRPDIHCVHTAPVSPVCYTSQCNGLFFTYDYCPTPHDHHYQPDQHDRHEA